MMNLTAIKPEQHTTKVERKFVVYRPNIITLSNYFLFTLIYITQTFLVNKGGDCHVRKEVCGKDVKYFYGRKVCDRKKKLRIIAEDREISKEEYDKLIETKAHPKAKVIKKIRYCFEYREQIFNLDFLANEVKNPKYVPATQTDEAQDVESTENQDNKPVEPEYLLSKDEAILMIELFISTEKIEIPRQIICEKEITNELTYTTKNLSKILKQQEDEENQQGTQKQD